MKRICLFLFCFLFLAGFEGASNALTIPATVGVSAAPGAEPVLEQGVTMVEGNRKAIFYFNVTGLPTGSALNSATLRLLLPGLPNGGSSVSVYKISGVWMQQSSSFGPVIYVAPLTSVPGAQVPPNRMLEVDVTSLVRDWANAPTGVEGFLVTGSFGEGGSAMVPLNFQGATTFGLTASLEVNPQEALANVSVDPYEQWPLSLKSRVVSPVITVQPWVASGGSLSVSAHGAGVLGYQWYRDGVALAGATGPQLPMDGLQSGSYVVRVQNGYGAVNSGVFTLGGDSAGIGGKVRTALLKTASFKGANFAIKADGTLWAWGYNFSGGLGLGTSGDMVGTPTRVGTSSNWSSVVTDGDGTFALKTDGTLWAWGGNWDGRLGLGTSGSTLMTPTQVGNSSDWESVVSNGATFAIKRDGTLWAWGNNGNDRLGLETSEWTVMTPTQVGDSHDWKSIVSGASTFGIKKDGSLWAWGWNQSGELGIGVSGANVNRPTRVGDASDWESVVSNGATFAIKRDGTLWAWGSNWNGGLGLGSDAAQSDVSTPTQIGGTGRWVSIATRGGRTFGLKSDGTLWAWGNNQNGELGLGTSGGVVSAPAQVGNAADWSGLFVGQTSTFAIKMDGSLWAWGSNQSGRLGTSSSEYRVLTPTRVGLDASWSLVSNSTDIMGGVNMNFGFKTDGSLWAWGDNPESSLGAGSNDYTVTTPTWIESTVPWKIPSAYQIDTNSPSPAGVPVPRIRTGSPLALRIAAPASDSVAAVEWYVEGTRVRTVRTAPWGATVQAPSLEGDAPSRRLVVEARVLSASGQLLDTVRQELDVVRDPISPVVVGLPQVVTSLSGTRVSLSFSKSLDSASVAGALRVLSAGTDGLTGSADDFVIQGGTVSVSDKTVTIAFQNGLGAGLYRLVVDGGLLDAVGNPLGGEYVTDFVNTTSIWMGQALGFWTDPANWSGGVVPFDGADVVFPATAEGRVVVGGSQNMVSLRSLEIQGPTALVNAHLNVAQNVSLFADLIFSGDNDLRTGGIVENLRAPGGEGEGANVTRYRMKLLVGVGTGDLVPGQVVTQNAFLRLPNGLTLNENLEVETAGMGGSTQLEVDSALNLRGHTLRVLGGYAGGLKFGNGAPGASGRGGFAITGPGKIAFDWVEGVVANPATQPEKLVMSVNAPAFVLPAGVELNVAGRGKVTVLSPGFTNAGVVRVANGGFLTVMNYTKAGINAAEWVAGSGVFEIAVPKVPATKTSVVKTASIVDGCKLVIKEDGTLWAWGYNWQGQLGVGSTMDIAVPTQVGTGTDWSSVVSSGNSTFALKTDGTLWAWGGNMNGQLGIGTSGGSVLSPRQVGESSDWDTVIPSYGGTFGIKKDGTLWAWGQNGSGELGIGTSGSMVMTPTQVGSDSDWASVVSNGATFGIKKDGTLWAWGPNSEGRLGLETSESTVMTPMQVGNDNHWASVVSQGSTFGIKTDGTLWAWGFNMMGELGLGSSGATVRTPTQVGDANNWATVVSAGATYGIKTDGTLWAWGYNQSGELGIGMGGSNVTTPTQVGTDQDWVSVSTWGSTFGLKTNGTLWAWGFNMSGQLGLGTSGATVTMPTQVGTDTDWFLVFAANGSFAFKSDASLWAWGDNWNGSLGTGSRVNSLMSPTKIESLVPWKLPASRP